MRKIEDFGHIESLLGQVFSREEPRAAFTAGLRSELAQSAPLVRPKAPTWRPRVAWGFAALVLVLVWAVVLIGPRNVLAQFGRWFGFLPDYGFVQSSEPLAIGQSVYQDTATGRVTLVSGFADAEKTLIHLEFEQEARAPGQLWLEGEDGVLQLVAWGFTPDQPGSRGLELRFEALSDVSSGWVLRSDTGWNLPLHWQPAASSNLLQPNLLATPSSAADPTAVGPDLRQCIAREEIRVCLSAVSVNGNQISLLMESPLADAGRLHAALFEQFVDPEMPEEKPSIRDAQGSTIFLAVSGRSERGGFTAYTFTGTLPPDFDLKGRLALWLPAVQYRMPLAEELSISIPEDMQDGESFTLDQSLNLGTGILHFGTAQLTGSRLFISSDPFNPANNTQLVSIEISKPERVDDLYGSGREVSEDGVRARIMLELNQSAGRLSGEVKLPVVGAYFLWQDPEHIQFHVSDLPGPLQPQPAQMVPTLPADLGAYPAEIPIIWHQEVLASESLVYFAQEDETTAVFEASAQTDFSFKPWLEIPGQLAGLKAIPERNGIAFILGVNDENPDWVFRQTSLKALYFAPIGQAAQRVTPFSPYAVEAVWHPDGQVLAVLNREEGPGHRYTSTLQLINLLDGSARQLPLGNFWTHWLTWANAGDKLALIAISDTPESSRSDILVIDLEQDQPAISTISPSANSSLYLNGPLMWLGDDSALLALCEESSLCQADLGGTPQVIATGLDLGIIRSGLVAQRWFPRFTQDRQAAQTELWAYDLLTQKDKAFLAIPTGEATKSQGSILNLAAGRWSGLFAAYTTARDLEIFDLVSGQHWQSSLPAFNSSQWERGSMFWMD